MKTVARGAAFLDVRLPGWEDDIDTATLDLSDECGCVLGQLGKRLGTLGTYGCVQDALGLSDAESQRLGYFRWSTGSWPSLTHAWRAAIHARRDANAQRGDG